LEAPDKPLKSRFFYMFAVFYDQCQWKKDLADETGNNPRETHRFQRKSVTTQSRGAACLSANPGMHGSL